MSLCENCEHMRRDYFIAEKRVCTLTGKVLVSDKRSCKKFKPKYAEQERLDGGTTMSRIKEGVNGNAKPQRA